MKGKMVYIFTNSYLPVLGGIQTVTSQLGEGLVNRGIKCQVITKLYPLGLSVTEKINGVRVFRFPFFPPDGSIRSKIFNHISFLETLIIFCLKRPNTVYVHFPESQISTIIKLRKLFKFKIITCFHGHDVMRHEGQNWNKHDCHLQAITQLLRISSYATACSKYLADKVRSVFNPPCKVVSIYNGVNLSRFDVQTTQPEIEYLFAWGRLEENKGFGLLIKSFSKVAERYPDLNLIIAGEGKQRNELEKLIAECHLDNRIFLPGKQSQSEIVRYAKNARVNIIPSLQESFGVVGLEAIAALRPIVCTKTGGLSEFMPKFAIMVEPTIESIKSGIIQSMDRPSIDKHEVAKFLQEFTIDNMVNNYLSLND